MAHRLVFRRCALCALVLVSACLLGAASPPPPLQNSHVSLAFDGTDGKLSAFTDATSGTGFLAHPGELWRIEWLQPEGLPSLTPGMARHFEWAAKDAESLELRWADFGVEQCPGLRVIVRVELPAEAALASWHIAVEGLGGTRIREVVFPRLDALAPQPGESVAVPFWMGERSTRARESLNPASGAARRLAWEYPGLLSLQCMAWCRENGPGLYLACDDTACHRKQFAVHGGPGNGLGMEVAAQPAGGADNGENYSLPYHVLAGPLHGDWFAAAQQYRGWAKTQEWTKQSRLRRGLLPAWVTDTGLWVWNRGVPEGVLPPALELREKAGLPVSVFWHWWHGCSYDTGFPEYLPPRGGADAFRAALSAAQEKNLHAIVYMNQRLWCMGTKSWADEGAERFAVKNAEGRVTPEVYNTYTKAPCASMCMGTPFWREKYAGIAAEAILRLGGNGIYMDQACSSLACYDPAHGHPLGGGQWWMRGFQTLAADIRSRTGAHTPALAGEGCGEAWLPHLDLMLSLQVSLERYAEPGIWEPIPFFHAVYHDCAVLYGNYSSLASPPYDPLWPAEFAPKKPLELLDRKFSTQFMLEQARSFVWGQQPTLANFRPEQLTERTDEMAFFLQLVRLRQKAKDFLLYGEMLPFPKLNAPAAEIPISRLSIYAGQQGAVREHAKRVETVLSGMWRAPDGRVALALANIGSNAASLDFTIDTGTWPIPAAGTVARVSVGDESPLLSYKDGQARIQLELAAKSATVLLFR